MARECDDLALTDEWDEFMGSIHSAQRIISEIASRYSMTYNQLMSLSFPTRVYL
jgi:hypothetical protein